MSFITHINTSFRTICFFLLIVGFFKANSQIILQDTVSGNSREISYGTKIFYTLYSDSVLGIEMTPDYGILSTSYDSILVFNDGTEVNKNDISFLEIDRKGIRKWKNFAKPFLITGMGILSKGVLMAFAEGTDGKNEEIVPVYIHRICNNRVSSIPLLRTNHRPYQWQLPHTNTVVL